LLSDIAKVEALLSGITRRDLDRLRPEMAINLARALRRVADIADPPPQAPPSTQDLAAAARRACEALHAGVLGQLRGGERAEDHDELRCIRPRRP
jgi:hypothetical protein